MKNEIDQQIFNLMDALRSPILTHSQSWADAIPKRILDLITMERMKYLIMQKEEATEPEAVAFIMTATLDAPMHGEWVEIYTHLSCKVLQDHFGEDHWDEVRAPRELTDYMKTQFLNPLLRHIYEKRRKILKERMKKEKPVENITREINNKPHVLQTQLQMQF